MNKLLFHIVEFSIMFSIMYLAFRLLIYRERFHRLNRFTLLAIPCISLLLTIVKFNLPADMSDQFTKIVPVRNIQETILQAQSPDIKNNVELQITDYQTGSRHENDFTIPYFFIVFALISTIMLFRLVWQNLVILHMIKRSAVRQEGKLRLVEINKELSPFSYFNYVFLNPLNINKSEIKDILAHEYIHYIQRHSRDNLYLEVVGLFQWFNPFYWFLRASIKETHEYLADEGVLNQGTDRSNYQALLLNQVAECPVPAVTCNLSQSLTKKRIIMMQKSKKSIQRAMIKFFAFLPVILLLAIIFSCNAQSRQKEKYVGAVSPTKMNVLYLGADNPVTIAVSGTTPEQISVETDNGDIKGSLGEYIVNPAEAGKATIKVYKIKKGGKELILEKMFRVKIIPDPRAYVGGRKGGEITREALLKANRVQAVMENFDFDLSFKVVGFVLTTNVPGTNKVREEISDGDTFSKKQVDLIKNLVKNQKIYFENIIITGPDGRKRKLGPVGFEITG